MEMPLSLRKKTIKNNITKRECRGPLEYLHSSPVPHYLSRFLLKLIVPTKTKNLSPKHERKANSIAQDICYAVTKGTWLLPKQLLLGMAIHH